MIKFLKHRRIYYITSLIFIIGSIFSLGVLGLNLGIEFTGGSIMEIEYLDERPSIDELRALLSDIDLGEVIIQPTGESGFILRMADVSKEDYEAIRNQLVGTIEHRSDSIGPTIGDELKNKALISIILASLAIVIYITITFSGSSGKTIKSWQYGVIATGIAFLHDVLIVLGIFALLGHFLDVQVTIPIIVALLAVLGYSVNDTVVIFDRVRENVLKNPRLTFSDIVNKSLNETLGRSINTSLTTIFVLTAILFFGGETLRWFVLAMIMGISLGTYSSLFLAGPLLVSWSNLNLKALRNK